MDQQTGHENHEMSCALYEELVALKIRIAFAEIDEDELAEFDRDLSSVSEGYYSDAAQKRTLKLIERKLNKRLRRQFVSKTLPHTLQIVTISLLLFFIGLTTAIATVQPVRLKIMDFITKIEENYSAVGMNNNDNDVTVPEEWKGCYFPQYIPEAFVFSHVDNLYNSIHYVASDDRILEFNEFSDMVYSNVDIDKNSAFDIEINGNPGIAMTGTTSTTITWCIDDVYFTIYFSGGLDEAQRIAESVRLIQLK